MTFRLRKEFPAVALLTAVVAFSSTARQPPRRIMINLDKVGQLSAGPQRPLALSPDGTALVVAAERGGRTQLYLGKRERFEPEPLPGTEDGNNPFFSPNGKWVGFFSGGKMKKVSVTGERSISICDAPSDSRGASWGPDDHIIFAPSGASGLYRVPAAGGTPVSLTTPDTSRGEHSHRWPEVLPDGRTVIFTIWGSYEAKNAPIALLSLDSGERRILLRGGTDARYSPTGHLLYAQIAGLFAVPFDLETLRVTGSPASVLGEVKAHPVSGAGYFAISPSGALLYVPGDRLARKTLVWVDRQGKATPFSGEQHDYWYPRLSPDGRRVAVRINEKDGRRDIWIHEDGQDKARRLIPSYEGENLFPAWTPDGKRVTFNSIRAESFHLYWRVVDGDGVTERLLERDNQQVPGSWSPACDVLSFYEVHPSTQRDIWILSMKGERTAAPFVVTPFNELAPMFSPDGRWIAYVSNRSGRNEIYVQAYPGPGEPWPISTQGGGEPVWGPSGRELFYRQGDRMWVVPIETGPTLSTGKPQIVFEGHYATNPYGNPFYDVAPDSQRFLMVQPTPESTRSRLHVLVDWRNN